jgi:hypothetical protein
LLQLKGLDLISLELPSSSTTKEELALLQKAFPKTNLTVPNVRGKKIDTDTKTIFSPLH